MFHSRFHSFDFILSLFFPRISNIMIHCVYSSMTIVDLQKKKEEKAPCQLCLCICVYVCVLYMKERNA